MYKIVGDDGKEYGPVTAEQLRQWQSEGRVNVNTRVMDTDSGQWTTIGAMAGAGAGAGAPPRAAPPAAAPQGEDPVAFTEAMIARGVKVDIGACVSGAWNLYKSDFWGILGPMLLGSLILGFVMLLFFIPYVGLLIGGVIAIVVGGPLTGGLWHFILKKKRGQPAQLGDIFSGFSLAFVPLMLTSIVMGILTEIGIFCCILPGIYLVVAWCFAIPLVIDRRFGFWDAMEVSRKVITKNWFMVFVLLIVASILASLGYLACCIGVIFTMPLSLLIMAYAYDGIFGADAPTQQ
jgi:hypothetical protein